MADYLIQKGNFGTNVSLLEETVRSAEEGNPDKTVSAALDDAQRKFDEAVKSFTDSLDGIEKGEHPAADTVIASQRALQQALQNLWNPAVQELDRLLKARMHHLQAKMWASLCFTALILAFAVLVAWFIDRSIARPLRGLHGAMLKLAGGDTEFLHSLCHAER